MKSEIDISENINSGILAGQKCRTCLKENAKEYVSLFEMSGDATYSKKLMLCTRVLIHKDDNLPKLICLECVRELENADKFRIKCEGSDMILNRLHPQQFDKLNVFDVKNENKSLHTESLKNEDTEYTINGEHMIDYCISEDEALNLSIKRKKKKRKIKAENVLGEDGGIKPKTKISDSSVIELENSKENIFKCSQCEVVAKTEQLLNRHVKKEHAKVHMGLGAVSGQGTMKKYHCNTCSYVTRFRQSLIYHLHTHTGEKPYECDQCEKSFSQPGSLSCHKKTHSDMTYYMCSRCGKQFKYKDTYEAHRNVHSTDAIFSCSVCNKGLKSQVTLKAHMNRHYNIKNYSCETCGKTFVTRVELTNHSKTHRSNTDFKCNQCHFRTNIKKGLDMHLLRHSGHRQFKCDTCEKAFYSHGELKSHLRKHSQEKKFVCPLCPVVFAHSSSVNKHMLKTHGIKYKRNDIVNRRSVKQIENHGIIITQEEPKNVY